MANLLTASVVRQLGSLFEGGSVAGLSDRQLLDRFVTRRDAAGEAAFAALVARHGPMVLGVCRQLLGDRHHAEDAFQAVFLVLARRARSIRDPDLLGNWLYGVALRTARKAKGRLTRRRRNEEEAVLRLPESRLRPGRSRRDRSRAGRGPARRGREIAGRLSYAGRALLLRGALARRGGATAGLSGRDRAQPPGPGARQTPPRPHPPRRRLARRRTRRDPRSQDRVGLRVGLRLILPVRHHNPGRD